MGVNIQTIKDIRFYLAEELKEIYKEPEIIALTGIIIKTVVNIPRLHQLYMPEQPVTIGQKRKITELCNELKTGKPVQYILGETDFYNCKIKVNRAILIPRQETEELVDLIIRENIGYTGNLIDFGTGSGCIAIALAVNLPGAAVTGIDISEEAIRIAQENALLNNVAITFSVSNIFDLDLMKTGKAGIIVSNPPYVRDSEKQVMSKTVLDFEPHIALFVTDSDPLLYYRTLAKLAQNILIPGGRLYFEINEAMGKSMIILLESFGYSEIEIVEDINGKERIIKGTRNV